VVFALLLGVDSAPHFKALYVHLSVCCWSKKHLKTLQDCKTKRRHL